MIAILEARRAGLLGVRHWVPNAVAGLIVGVVALPLAMAFAIASGARPEQGIYTAIVAGLVVSLFGGSRLQIAGPTGAFVAVLAGITLSHGIAGLQIATVMAGLMMVAMGVARLGGVIRFIPQPVIVGFTAGIALIILVGQWRDFFGLPASAGVPAAHHFHQKVWELLLSMPALHGPTTALAIASLVLLLGAPRLRLLARLPGPLVAMLAITAVQAWVGFEGVATIGSAFGGIPRGLPTLAFPEVSIDLVIVLVGPAFAIAMLGAIESLLSAVVADGMAGTRHDSNQELLGQGLANIAAPLFGGFAATGALARTATNVRNGATGPLAGIAHVATLVAVLLLLAPLASHIPLAALAAILFVVAWNMSEWRHVVRIVRRAPRADAAILLVTFALTVFTDVVVAVNIGVILATLHFLRRMAQTVEVQRVAPDALASELAPLDLGVLPSGLLVYEIDGPFFFGAVDSLERALLQTHTEPGALIVRLRRVPFADITGLLALEGAITELQRRGVRVMLCEATPRVHAKLVRAGVLDVLGAGNYADALAPLVAGEVARRAAALGQA